MRRLTLVSLVALASCGTPPPPTTAMPATVAVHPDLGITLRDIGASKSGCTVVVPANHELQLAVVVIRDGQFSASESTLLRRGSNQERSEACSLLAFYAKGPLRPESSDALVIVSGGPTLRVATPHGPSCSLPGETTMGVGKPFQSLANMTWGKPGQGYSSDPRMPEGVLLGVHLYARVVPIDSSNRYYQEMRQHLGSGYAYGADEKLEGLEAVLPMGQMVKPSGAF